MVVDKCPNCGSDVPPQARFCPNCGTVIIPPTPETSPSASRADEGYARFYSDDSGNPAGAPQQPASRPIESQQVASSIPQAPVPQQPTPAAPPISQPPISQPSMSQAAPSAPAQPAWPSAPEPPQQTQPSVPQAAYTPSASTGPNYGGNDYSGAGNVPPYSNGMGHGGSGNGNGNDYGGDDDDRPSRPIWPWLAGAALLVVGGVLAYGFMQDGRELTPITDTGSGAGETTSGAPATVINPRVSLFVAADANVRDKPTVSGSNVVSKLKRGSEVKGDIVAGAKGDQWLKLEGQEAYVSMINLMKDAPAILVSTSSTDATIKTRCSVLARAESGAPVKVTLDPGAKIKVTGLTEGGFAEFALPRGGSGYVANEGKACLSGGEELVINFDPGACDFGSEIEGFFKKATPVNNEGDTSYTAVNRSFKGIPVNSAFTAWETTGLTFDGSIAQVRAAFLAAGYKLDAENNFIPPADSEAVASASLDPRNPSDKRGRTQLSCGV